MVLGSGLGEFAGVLFSGLASLPVCKIGGSAGSEVVLGSGKRRAVKGSVVGAWIGRQLAGEGRTYGSAVGRHIIGGLFRSALPGAGLSDQRVVDGSVLRVVVASIGPAVGIGVAVGIELRRALHRSAGAAAGLRIDGS